MTSSPRNLQHSLLLSSANFRHGVALKPQVATTGMSDIPGIYHVGIPQNSSEPWKSAAGGVGRTRQSAYISAVGEALERYAGYTFPLPVRARNECNPKITIGAESFSLFTEDQRGLADFPFAGLYADDAHLTNVYDVTDNSEHWVPHGLVSLRDDYATGVSTSSGMAAGPTATTALLRGIQELIERDALMITWLHSLPGRQIALPESYTKLVGSLAGQVTCIDATPNYSPHPVAIVCGSLPIRGNRRFSLGAACRETWKEAVEKAYLEWAQGVFFAGYFYSLNPELRYESYDVVNTFDAHAVYYTVHPTEWTKIPLLQDPSQYRPSTGRRSASHLTALTNLVRRLKREKIRMYYRDLTTPDLHQVGVRAVRALSPDLAPIFCHQRLPFLGGTVKDVERRYPWATNKKGRFPNPMPHPLG